MRSGLFRTYGNRPGPAGLHPSSGHASETGPAPDRPGSQAALSAETDICAFLEEFSRTSEPAGTGSVRHNEDRAKAALRAQRPALSPLLRTGPGRGPAPNRSTGLRAG